MSGVSEFESEGRKWNVEEPQLMGSHQRGIEELLLPGMSWGGVGALYHNGKKACVCLCLPAAELRTTELPLELRYLLGSAHKYTYTGCLQVLKNSSNAIDRKKSKYKCINK